MESRVALFLVLIFPFLPGSKAAVFTLQNRCKQTIWPGFQPCSGKSLLANGGMELLPNQQAVVSAPAGWSGRFWPRTGCKFDISGGIGKCTTGDCYDVSLVDGFNVPVSIVPYGGMGNCSAVKCTADVNQECPENLRVRVESGATVACKSPCEAFNEA